MATSLNRSLRSHRERRYSDERISDWGDEEAHVTRKSGRRSARLSHESISNGDDERYDSSDLDEVTTRRSSRRRKSQHVVEIIDVDEEEENRENGRDPRSRRSSRSTRSSFGSERSTPSSGSSHNSSRHRGTRVTRSRQKEEESRRYSFRNRDEVRRQTYNASQLGGENDDEEKDDELEEEEEHDEDEEELDENDEDNDNNDDDDDDEEEVEEDTGKKYSFRDRSNTRRKMLNIDEQSAQNKSYAGEEERSHLKLKSSRGAKRDHNGMRKSNGIHQEDNFSYKEKRIYLGGRLPSPVKKDRDKRRERSKRRKYRSSSRSRRHFDSSSDSSSSSSSGSNFRDSRRRRQHNGSISDEDENFQEHEHHRLSRERESIVPISIGNGHSRCGGKDQASRRDMIKADVLPIEIESSIGFESVGGLDSHLRALREMVILPLLYPDVFRHFDTQPPRGVLFSGPPGCGKVSV